MLAVFKQMIEVVMLLHNKGYIHTDITSKSFRFFPSSPDKSSFYADNANGQVKLSGLQHAVTFAKTYGRSICNPAYAVPAKFRSTSSSADVTQDQAVRACMIARRIFVKQSRDARAGVVPCHGSS
jgi:hypothetical protein